MRAELVFIWTDGRRDDRESVLMESVPRKVLRDRVWFGLRDWEVRYEDGARVTHLAYAEGLSSVAVS